MKKLIVVALTLLTALFVALPAGAATSYSPPPVNGPVANSPVANVTSYYTHYGYGYSTWRVNAGTSWYWAVNFNAHGVNGSRTVLRLQGDCNLVMTDYDYSGATPTHPQVWWASGTNGYLNCHMDWQNDGNIVIYSGPQAVWSTGTARGAYSYVWYLQDNTCFSVYQFGSDLHWHGLKAFC